MNRNAKENKLLSILLCKKFSPLLGTIFLGAFNDNLLKNGLIFLLTYQAVGIFGFDPAGTIAVASGLLVIPFFLFSSLAGQIADKFEKTRSIKIIKFFEILIMILAYIGFYSENFEFLLFVIFLMGVQSSFFSPLKYGILPEQLNDKQIVAGNALAQASTFLAILLGTLGGVVVRMEEAGLRLFLASLIIVAIAGWVSSLLIPRSSPGYSDLKLSLDPFSKSIEILKLAFKDRSVFWSILGNSWFWFLGAAILNILPILASEFLRVDEIVLTVFLLIFTVGIALGSIACEKLSRKRLEIGLVPLGSLGMFIALMDLALIGRPDYLATVAYGELIGIKAFFDSWDGINVAIDLGVLSVFSGFYIVPLQTIIQKRSPKEIRSRVIAANNLLNAIFLVGASVFLIALYRLGLSVPQVILVIALMTAAVSLVIFDLVPEFFLRFISYLISRILYRVECRGDENIPDQGPAVLVCNHVSFVDWMVIAGAIKRPVRFVMTKTFFKGFLIKKLLRRGKVIPIAPQKVDAKIYEEAFRLIKDELEAGELVCIFPEGKLTLDGEMNEFKKGIEKIVAETPVPVVPMALRGFWGSMFTLKYGRNFFKWPRKLGAKIELLITKAVSAEDAKAEQLRSIVLELRGDQK